MTLTELLDRLIAGEIVTPAEAYSVKEQLAKNSFGSLDLAGDRLRKAADRLQD